MLTPELVFETGRFSYADAEHMSDLWIRAYPVMREISAALQSATGCDLANAPTGTDGCSIPTFGIPLRQLARGFARLASGQGLSVGHATAAKRLRQAVAKSAEELDLVATVIADRVERQAANEASTTYTTSNTRLN